MRVWIRCVSLQPGSTTTARLNFNISGRIKTGGLRQESGTWETRWSDRGGDWRLEFFQEFEAARAESRETVFEDVTHTAIRTSAAFQRQLAKGTEQWARRLDVASGIDLYGLNGIAVGDYNGDGWDDFYVCQPGGLPNRLFRNQGDGTFIDVTDEAGVGVLDATSSALWVDFRNRGTQDLLMVTSAGLLLFESDGRGRFKRAHAQFSIPANERGSMMMASAADYNNDGFVDIYVCQYSAAGSAMANLLDQPLPYFDAQNGAPNHLFRNNGDGTFTNVTKQAGLNKNNSRWSFAAGWADYDSDGDPDLYVANDFGRNNLYRNDGNGTFTDVAAEAGVEDPGPGMGVAWGDYDRDGHPDLYVSNIWSAVGQRRMAEPHFQTSASAAARALMRRFAEGNTLYRNRGDGTFEATTAQAGVANGGWAWASGFLDAGNEGRDDILVMNGHVTGDSGRDLEAFHWTDVVGNSPEHVARSGRYENGWREFHKRMAEDGWSAHGLERQRFFVSQKRAHAIDRVFADASALSGLDFSDDGRAFGVLDFDSDGRLDIVLKNRTAPQIRVMRNRGTASNHFLAFSLQGTRANRDGIGSRLTLDCGGDTQTKQVEAGSGFNSQHSKRVHFGLGRCNGPANVRVRWPGGGTETIKDLAVDQIVQIVEGSGSARKFTLREPDSRLPSETATPAADESGSWLIEPMWIPLSLSRPEPPFAIIAPEGASSRAAVIATASANAISRRRQAIDLQLPGIVLRRLFIIPPDVSKPFAILFDQEGLAAKVYWKTPDDRDLLRDIALLSRKSDRERAGLPFAGQRYGAAVSRFESFFRIAMDCLESGLEGPALQYFEYARKLEPQNGTVLSGIGTLKARGNKLADALVYFERAAALDPASVPIRFNVGTTLARLGRFQEAAVQLVRASEMDPGSAEIWANLGNAYLDLHDLQNARSALERALALDPKSPALRNSLGTLFAELGSLKPAEEHLLEATRLKPDFEDAYFNLGMLYAHTGDRGKAAEMLNQCLRLNPRNEAARRLLGQVR